MFSSLSYSIALQQLRPSLSRREIFLNRQDAKSAKVLMFSPPLVAD
jgi:hypothetical protein